MELLFGDLATENIIIIIVAWAILSFFTGMPIFSPKACKTEEGPVFCSCVSDGVSGRLF